MMDYRLYAAILIVIGALIALVALVDMLRRIKREQTPLDKPGHVAAPILKPKPKRRGKL